VRRHHRGQEAVRSAPSAGVAELPLALQLRPECGRPGARPLVAPRSRPRAVSGQPSAEALRLKVALDEGEVGLRDGHEAEVPGDPLMHLQRHAGGLVEHRVIEGGLDGLEGVVQRRLEALRCLQHPVVGHRGRGERGLHRGLHPLVAVVVEQHHAAGDVGGLRCLELRVLEVSHALPPSRSRSSPACPVGSPQLQGSPRPTRCSSVSRAGKLTGRSVTGVIRALLDSPSRR
jgi:hypothetical protein